MFTKFARPLLAAALALSAGVAASPASAAPSAMTLVGMNPASTAQRTQAGKAITAMQAFEGRIYLGIGDWNANTGPTPIVAYDPATASFNREFVSDTEAVHRFAVVRGELFAPSTDRAGTTDYARRSADGTWADKPGLGSTHVFDWGTSNGEDLLAVGSAGSSAVVWRSTDDGSTWTRSLVVRPTRYTINRFQSLWSLGGKVYVQGFEDATARVFDGQTWSTTALNFKAAGMDKPTTFRGQLVGTIWSGPKNGIFDGTSFRRMPYGGPTAVAGDTLYTLNMSNGVIYATKDLRRYVAVAKAPVYALSLAADATGGLFVGTSTGQVWSNRTP